MRMSIGEHLDELRKRIVLALLGLGLGMAAGLVLAPSIIGMLKGPYTEAMESIGLEPNLIVLEVSAGVISYLKVAFYARLVLS